MITAISETVKATGEIQLLAKRYPTLGEKVEKPE